MSVQARVCIIGAGTAGLSALKRSLEYGFDAVAYEKADEVGGTWIYTEQINIDSEEEVHSSMYEGLRTNLPKEVMGYPDYQYSHDIKESFIGSQDVFRFLQNYAKNFQLLPHIRFQHEVVHVRPNKNHWEILVKNIKTKEFDMQRFDYVFVCNGHYTRPKYPEIDGLENYQGRKIHSHLYRRADEFKDATVLVIGCGGSGIDIAIQIQNFARKVYLSHHVNPPPDTNGFPKLIQKPDIKRFTPNGAIFMDDSEETFSCILFCTGYKYCFPFLSMDAELHTDENCIYPLYKQCININYPTMALIGLPLHICPTHMCDLQVRFALAHYTGRKQFPIRGEMLSDLQNDLNKRRVSGLQKRQAHLMGIRQFDYYQDLADTADIEPIKPVICNVMKECSRQCLAVPASCRNYYFKIIDDKTFIKKSEPIEN